MRFVLPMLALVPVALALEYAHIGGRDRGIPGVRAVVDSTRGTAGSRH